MGTSYPSSEAIAAAWVQSIGLAASAGTDLPADPATWATHGYVQVSTVGGHPEQDIPLMRPVVQLDVWANRPGAATPPWALAGDVAGQIVAACYDSDLYGQLVPLPAAFRPVRVFTVIPVSEPRRVHGDPAGFARVTLDCSMTWGWA